MKHHKVMMAMALAILMSSGGNLLAQTATQKPTTPKTNSKPVPPPPPVASPDYLIGPADVLRIDVVDEAAYSGDFIVRPDGKISMLQVDEVVAAGLTTDALKKKIKTELGRFFEEGSVPEVFVQVKAINSRIVYIQGAIRRPGPYPLPGPMTIAQLIAVAGGLEEFASRKRILVISGTQRNAKGESITWTVNYEDIEKGRNLPKNNIILNPGDTVMVPGGQP